MVKFFLFTVLLGGLALGLLACEIPPADRAETGAAPTAAPTVAPTAAPTVAPTAAPTVAPTVELATVRVTGAVVNLRAGPSVQYAVLGQVEAGDRLPVTGVSRNRTWLQVQTEAERRWIFADLTDVSAELRAELAEVAAPALEGSVSTSAGQSQSAAAELVAPTATPVPADAGHRQTEYHAPGTYDRSLYPGLRYEWELTFTDNSELWDWEIVDFQGCYDAIRVYIGELPEERGLQRVEMVLSDPFVEQNLHSYADQTTRRINSFYPTPSRDLNRFFALWPDWYEGNLPHSDFAYVSGICIPSDTAEDQICQVHPMWGNQGSANLDGSAALAMAAGLGASHMYGPTDAWLARRYRYSSFLVPMSVRDGFLYTVAGHGPCMRLTKN